MLNGKEVARRRDLLKMSQARLAKVVGVSQPVIAEIELGKQQSTRFILRLAKALGCSPKELDPEWVTVDANGEVATTPSLGIREIDANGGMGGGQTPHDNYAPTSKGMQAVDAYRPEAWVFPSRFMREGFGVSADRLLAVAAVGDSMQPTIPHGSVVFVDTRDTKIRPQELYALRDAYGEIIIKRLDLISHSDGWIVRIQSDNPVAKSRDEPLTEVAVVGRVRAILQLM